MIILRIRYIIASLFVLLITILFLLLLDIIRDIDVIHNVIKYRDFLLLKISLMRSVFFTLVINIFYHIFYLIIIKSIKNKLTKSFIFSSSISVLTYLLIAFMSNNFNIAIGLIKGEGVIFVIAFTTPYLFGFVNRILIRIFPMDN